MFERIDLRVEEMVDQGLLKVLLHTELVMLMLGRYWHFALCACKQPC